MQVDDGSGLRVSMAERESARALGGAQSTHRSLAEVASIAVVLAIVRVTLRALDLPEPLAP